MALNCDEAPTHNVDGFAFAETLGKVFTTIVCVPVVEQPFALVAVTVYVVVTDGFTVMEAPLAPPGCHTYVLAPEAVIVADCPKHIAGEFADKLSATALLNVAEALQPFAVTVTVYVPATGGIIYEVVALLLHAYCTGAVPLTLLAV